MLKKAYRFLLTELILEICYGSWVKTNKTQADKWNNILDSVFRLGYG